MKGRVLTLVTALAIITASDALADPTKDQCASANETGQSLRKSGKLRAAREQLLVCMNKSCPPIVRDDCAERLNDLEHATPTIVFLAKTDGGTDVPNVKVVMDGAVLKERLDGTALAVDPGEHVFELTSPGHSRVTKTLVIGEGVKRRQETISFPSAAVAADAKTTQPSSNPSERDAPTPGSTQRTLAIVVGALGLASIGVGTVFGLRASSTYDNALTQCPTTSTCSDEGVSGGQDAHSQAAISTVTFVIGGALIAGALALFFTAPNR